MNCRSCSVQTSASAVLACTVQPSALWCWAQRHNNILHSVSLKIWEACAEHVRCKFSDHVSPFSELYKETALCNFHSQAYFKFCELQFNIVTKNKNNAPTMFLHNSIHIKTILRMADLMERLEHVLNFLGFLA